MNIVKAGISSPEVIWLFSEHDDFMINFLGENSIYYTRYNEKESINDVWIAYCDGKSIGCAAYRTKSPGVGELKRMFIKSEYRGRGISKQLLAVVEEHAKQQGDHTLHLDTRIRLEPAVTLYRNSGFFETLRNGLYVEMEKKLDINDE